MNYSWLASTTALILDMDGVLWRDTESIGDLKSIFKRIDQLGLHVIFATNNATRTIHHYVKALETFGIYSDPEQIITSATAVVCLLKSMFPSGGPVCIVGEQGLIDACSENGYYHSDTEALAVIAGMDRYLTYTKLQTATLLLRKGVPFIGSNPDNTFPTPLGLVPGAGSILAALSAASSVIPVIAGKPEPIMYEIALKRLNETADHVLVVGDRPETDIAGAQKIGCRTALVLSGVTNEIQAAAWQPAPDIITDNLETLINIKWSLHS
jgi:4-nitrophenyl phosphatase